MPVTISNVYTGSSGSSATDLDVTSVVVAAGERIVVGFSGTGFAQTGNTIAATSVDWGADTDVGTLITGSDIDQASVDFCEMWEIDFPTPGTQTLTINYSPSGACLATVWVLSGAGPAVDVTTEVGTGLTAHDVTVPNVTADDFVLGMILYSGSNNGFVGGENITNDNDNTFADHGSKDGSLSTTGFFGGTTNSGRDNLICAVRIPPGSVVQALTNDNVFSADPYDLTFTGDLTRHESTLNGRNPAAGNNIVVAVRRTGGTSIDTVELRDASTNVEPAVSSDLSLDSGQLQFFHFSDIGSGITTVRVNVTGSASFQVMVLEDAGDDLTVDDTSTYDSQGFGTTWSMTYSAGSADALGVMFVRGSIGTLDYNDGSNGTALAFDNSTRFAASYKEITASGSGTIDIDLAAGGSGNSGYITYTRGAAGSDAPALIHNMKQQV